jgi:hypothetical protein
MHHESDQYWRNVRKPLASGRSRGFGFIVGGKKMTSGSAMKVEKRNTTDIMGAVGTLLDRALNGDAEGENRTMGWVVLLYPLDGRPCTSRYSSNLDRQGLATVLREQADRLDKLDEKKQ